MQCWIVELMNWWIVQCSIHSFSQLAEQFHALRPLDISTITQFNYIQCPFLILILILIIYLSAFYWSVRLHLPGQSLLPISMAITSPHGIWWLLEWSVQVYRPYPWWVYRNVGMSIFIFSVYSFTIIGYLIIAFGYYRYFINMDWSLCINIWSDGLERHRIKPELLYFLFHNLSGQLCDCYSQLKFCRRRFWSTRNSTHSNHPSGADFDMGLYTSIRNQNDCLYRCIAICSINFGHHHLHHHDEGWIKSFF